ncbi:MAG: N-acetyltransferase [Candidatus Nanohaloarchaea archaeon]|nr:N-acetyltransferase [Candidatus Nanohaloarchaea archaeon]
MMVRDEYSERQYRDVLPAYYQRKYGLNQPGDGADPEPDIRQFEPGDEPRLVDAYRTVWTQEPWNEVFGLQAAYDQVREAVAPDSATALVAEPGDFSDRDVIDAVDYPEEPSYLLDGDEPAPDEERFFRELREPGIIGFTWALDAREAGDVPETGGFDELVAEETAYISELGVVPGYQSQGIGSRLSRELLDELEAEYDRVILRTNPEAEKAINLYEQLGFERTGLTDPEYEERVYLVKDLSEADG